MPTGIVSAPSLQTPIVERGAVPVEAQDVADARAERAPDLLGDEPEQPLGLHLGGHRRRHPAQRGLLLGQSLHGRSARRRSVTSRT